MEHIEQRIMLTGAEESAQQIQRVADSEEKVGDEAHQAGTKAKGGAEEFGLLGDVLGNAQRTAMGFVGSEGVFSMARMLGCSHRYRSYHHRRTPPTAAASTVRRRV